MEVWKVWDYKMKKSSPYIYEIDRNPLFEGFAHADDRSNMNATYNLKDNQHAVVFDALWNGANISGLKGHRSVRISRLHLQRNAY